MDNFSAVKREALLFNVSVNESEKILPVLGSSYCCDQAWAILDWYETKWSLLNPNRRFFNWICDSTLSLKF